MTASATARNTLKPPLKWAGGKRWQLPHLEPYLTSHRQRRLVEPFCGGLAVSIGLDPQHALLNDVNPHLINFYTWLKKGLLSQVTMKNDKTLFYQHRDRFNELIKAEQISTPESASLFYYLNRTAYNGLCRFNRHGSFNVPFGRYKTISYLSHFLEYKQLFNRWEFVCGDFTTLKLKPSDFIYADPPYDVEFTSYSSNKFSWDDQVRTAEWLSVHPGSVILVNQATTRIQKLYRRFGFTLRYLDAPRRISRTGDRSPAREVIGTRNL